jgi:hypothetical protein
MKFYETVYLQLLWLKIIKGKIAINILQYSNLHLSLKSTILCYKFTSRLLILTRVYTCCFFPMDQHALKNVNYILGTNIYYYLGISGGQSSNLYLMLLIFSIPVLIGHLWQLKTVVYTCCYIKSRQFFNIVLRQGLMLEAIHKRNLQL